MSGDANRNASVKVRFREVTTRTRTEPKPAAGGRILHVYPPDWKGQKQEPAFIGIMAAYYGAGLGDWNAVWKRKAQPGDTLVHVGLYIKRTASTTSIP